MSKTIRTLILGAVLAQIAGPAIAEDTEAIKSLKERAGMVRRLQTALAPQCKTEPEVIFQGCIVTVQLQHEVKDMGCTGYGAPKITYDACFMEPVINRPQN
jgi:hypothetical protein